MKHQVAVWPDGDWISLDDCTVEEMIDCGAHSDDYRILTEGDGLYELFMQNCIAEAIEVDDTVTQSALYDGDRVDLVA